VPTQPDVSVVIPTRGRPELVTRAVRSALAQTIENIEVIVVIDGPDGVSGDALKLIDDNRLRIIELPENHGAPNARNVGAGEARAAWTALLDDDDEWLPTKLATQLDLAERSPYEQPIVVSRLVHRTPRARFVVPRRVPGPGEPISEYLTVRRGLFHGDGFIQTSTIMAPTGLLRHVPFSVGLRRLQELDWTLRALREPGTGVAMAGEPLVIWYADENRPRVSFDSPWPEQLAWIRANRDLFTPRAYAALIMSAISAMAAPTHSPRAFATLLGEAHRRGRPGLLDYVTFLQVWLVPQGQRRRWRDLVLGNRHAQSAVTKRAPEA
jgi:glycosyltransferase involved in cell wall biosynthesis